MVLDFNNLTIEEQNKFDEIFHKNFNDIEKLLYKIIRKKSKRKFHFSNFTSRNPEENNLYYKLSILKLVEYYYKKKNLSKVILNDHLILNFLKKRFSKISFVSTNKKVKITSENILSFLKNIFFISKLFLLGNQNRMKNFLRKKNIILVDIFMIKSMFRNNEFKDRYYGNLFRKRTKQEIFFLPVFFNNSLNKKNLKFLGNKNQFILYSDFFKLKDYFEIFFSIIKFNFYSVNNIFFGKYDVSEIINNEIKKTRFSHSILISILNFQLFKNLKNKNANINSGINWFENQVVDKSFNFCFKKFFPNALLKGYLGINADLRVNKFLVPSKLEKKFNLIPSKMFIINNHNKKFFNKIYPKKNIKIAPAYRNQHIYKYLNSKPKNSKKFTVLVIFTASHEDSIQIINIINNLPIKLLKKISFTLRFHNFSKVQNLKSLIKEYVNYRINNYQPIYKLLIDSSCVLCRPGTTYYEAKIFQTPLILTRRIYSIMPINKKDLKNDGFCFGEKDIEKRIEYLINNTFTKKTKRELANFFFNIDTPEKTKNFLY